LTQRKIHRVLTYCIAAVWIVNGLFCKVFNLVPRHEQIVARILGNNYSRQFTLVIGFAEIGMAVWILSGIRTRLNAVAQIGIVAIMNTLEFVMVPDLLLWGRMNAVFAFILILVIYYNEFVVKTKQKKIRR
jgi:DoxX-like family